MCGIAGFFNAKVDQETITHVADKILHRGPDGHGSYNKNGVGLIHTRLSIIELSDLGAQPYRYENLVLSFNGELYNYQEVRNVLIQKGYTFTSNSDTEVLIKAFHCWREKCVDRFIGMFAFAVYDEQAHEMFLFRDRMGVKPLYYHYEKNTLYFASELKCLTTFPIGKEIDIQAAALYFRFGFVPGDLSIYRNASKLHPGCYLKVTSKGVSEHEYWKVNYQEEIVKSEDEWLDELESVIISSFKYRMVADVPVGIFLSGGIDSSLLTAVLQKHYGTIRTFTIGFEESGFDESIHAKKVAEALGTQHTEKILKLDEARGLLKKFYNIYDEPFADTSGIPTACVTQLAKAHGVKVALSADGGDELFGGYTHYQRVARLYGRLTSLPGWLKKGIPKASQILLPHALRASIFPFNFEHKAYALEEVLQAKTPHTLFEACIANQATGEIKRMIPDASLQPLPFMSLNDPLQSMMEWDRKYYLPDDLLVKVDRATMYYGIECREPFLDHRLVQFAATIPSSLKVKDGTGKYLLRKLLNRYLPHELFERKKQGFSIPIFDWFTKELDEMFVNYLTPEKLKEVSFLNGGEVVREFRKYKYYKDRGKQYNIEKMWRILSFMLWWEKYMKR
jgi:asparagine synthase (glutamine-hydrolysing)